MRLLPPPAEAEGGAPRGTLELTQCLRAARLLPDSLVVADGWRGYNRVDWLGEFGCAEPQRLNRRAGGIVNAEGFTSNHVGNLWSNARERAGGAYCVFQIYEFRGNIRPAPSVLPKTVGLKGGCATKRAV